MVGSRSRGYIRLLSVLIAAALLAGAAVPLFAAPFSDAQIAAIAREGAEAAASVMENKHSTAISVVLADARGVVWQGQYGEIVPGEGATPTASTVFGLCSVSKMFTTVAVMNLVDRGLVSLDAPVSQYIPDFSMEDPRYRDITVRMLLNHSSGLPGQQILGGMTIGAPYPEYAEHVVRAQASQYLKFAPGTDAVYTNDGFSVLETLVKRVSGNSFVDFLQSEIFDALGMRDSRCMTSPLPKGSFASPDIGAGVPDNFFINLYGTGGIFSSAEDMAKFASLFLAPGRLLSEASIRAMGQDQTTHMFYPLFPSDGFRFGLGWDSAHQPGMAAVGVDAWQKGGDLGFYGATLIVLPEEGLAAVVLGATNFGSSDAGSIGERVLLRALVERGKLGHMPQPAALRAAKAPAPDFRERAEIAGYYLGMPFALTRAVFDDAGTLTLEKQQGEDWIPYFEKLDKRVDGWYSGEDAPVSLKFVKNDGKTYYVIRYPSGAGHYLASAPLGQKIDVAPPMPEAWKSRLGTTWLLSSDILEAEDSVSPGNPSISPETLPEIPGYIFAVAMDGPQLMKPINGNTAAMWLTTPVAYSRDLKDLRAEMIGGVSYLRFGAELYRDVSSVPSVARGSTSVPMLKDPFGPCIGQWFRLPASGRVSTGGAALWRLYDKDFEMIASEHGDGTAAWSDDGSWIVVYPAAEAGATIAISD